MFYADHEKMIYSPQSAPELKYDPLALQRELIIHSGNKFDELWAQWAAVNDDSGDVSISKHTKAVESNLAEKELVAIARCAFNLPPFPDCLDATVLEYLRDFEEWMRGKGQRVIPM